MKILFISHDAHRAGAQLYLLNLLNCIKNNNTNVKFEVLLCRGGVLQGDFNKLCKVYQLEDYLKGTFLKKKYRRYKNKRIYKRILKSNYDIIYSNTILNGAILKKLKSLDSPVVSHIHELDYWIKKGGEENIELVKRNTNFYFTASKAVTKKLVDKYNFNGKLFKEVYVPIDIKKMENKSEYKSLKSFLGIEKEAKIVCACGTEDYRKGKDWFIPIAVSLLNSEELLQENIHFVWIGGKLTRSLIDDLNRVNKKNRIHFINQLPDANRYFNEIDVFLMLSREDPFPTVNLEVGALGIPVLGFKSTGGTEELLEEFEEALVDFGDIKGLMEKTLSILKDEKLNIELGMRLKNKVKEKYNIDYLVNKIITKLEDLSSK
ncbi:MAG: hypothetical protein COC22_02405 [Flavobacteriaceae bacterium]|nr:MAG: hypothetical protein COC22_02405 [Flavobacteriaceae bacterium]